LNEVIKKARDLLRLREQAATPGEAQAAARALAKMLDKHRLSIAELEMRGDQDSEDMVADTDEPLLSCSRLAGWKKGLIRILCSHYGVALWRRSYHSWSRGKRKLTQAMHMCGRPSDMTMVRYMLGWLSAEIERLSRQECAGMGVISHNSWRRGFVTGLGKQLRMARDDVAENNSEAALVLRKRQDDAQDFLHRAIEGLGKGRRNYHRVYHDPLAYADGKRRGEAQHLGDKLDSGLHRALPSGGSLA